MIPRRTWIIPIAAVLVLIATRCRADDKIDCATVRYYVAEHGKAAALAWALRNGYSWAEIRMAQRCIEPASSKTR